MFYKCLIEWLNDLNKVKFKIQLADLRWVFLARLVLLGRCFVLSYIISRKLFSSISCKPVISTKYIYALCTLFFPPSGSLKYKLLFFFFGCLAFWLCVATELRIQMNIARHNSLPIFCPIWTCRHWHATLCIPLSTGRVAWGTVKHIEVMLHCCYEKKYMGPYRNILVISITHDGKAKLRA